MATIERLVQSWRLALEAENKSDNTVYGYTEAVDKLCKYLTASERSHDVDAVTADDVRAFIAHQLATLKPSTALSRYKGCKLFFAWCVGEGEIGASPMQTMKPPFVPEDPPPVLTEAQVRKVLKGCAGPTFADRRDTAILLVFFDTGMRRAELANLAIVDVDFDLRVLNVLGKGGKHRACPFGRKTAQALDRYLRTRESHRLSYRDELWLGLRGPLTDDGVYQVIDRRGRAAGVEDLHAHLYRHTFAHEWLASGGAETDLMLLMGWTSRQMLGRYGKSAAAERARAAHRRLSPADRL